MADIDLKTETPDTSLPTTGFLFGADSQSAASPSVYSTQAVATALLGATSLTGATVTADSPVLNLAQTWNNAAVTFTGLKFNVPTDSSASGSLLMDLQVGGSSKFKVSKGGTVTTDSLQANVDLYWTRDLYALATNSKILLTGDTILTRRAAANLRLGAADAAAPVAQTLSVQSVVAGTTNTAGANLTITGSQGTGTGAGGSIVFQVAPAGSSGTAQNALVDALTLNSARQIVSAIAGSSSTPAYNFLSAGNGLYLSSNSLYFATSGGTVRFGFGTNGAELASTGVVGWSSSSTDASSAKDLLLFRDAANTLALRNGANAQTFRVYNTTDGTNSEFGSVKWDTNVLKIGVEAAGSGSASRNIEFAFGGTTRLTITATNGTTQSTGSFIAAAGFGFFMAGRSGIQSAANGVLSITNNAGTDFDRLQFGGTTSSFPALKRNSTALETKLADDSAYAPHAMQYLDVTDGITAPASATGRARIYVDTADGDLKVIFADGTVKTIVTDT